MSTVSRIGFVSLGCPKATVDSERILSRLRAEGYLFADRYEDADLVIVNTCGFINEAIEESFDAIEEALDASGRVVVTGCLGREQDTVWARFPGLQAVTGPADVEGVMAAVRRCCPVPADPFTSLLPATGIKLTPAHYAYLKISEGCNHRCSFCIIPHLRGDLVSRPAGSVMREAQALVEAGVQELCVISQDTSAYGVDLKYRTDFWGGRPLRSRVTDLAQALGELGVWVRLHYVYPYPHVDELIPLMADGRITPYLDMPLQHASPALLKAMRRPAQTEVMLARIARWRDICPDLTLRSTFIVGFPGETERDFEMLLEFLEQAELDRVGCFTYSPVAGAAANALPGAVPEPVKAERAERLSALQERISARKLARRRGERIEIVIDDAAEPGVFGRSQYEAPEVDGRVVVDWPGDPTELMVGDRLLVQITDSDAHDLFATPVDVWSVEETGDSLVG